MNNNVKKKITIFVVVGILLIAVLTGGFLYFLLDKDDEKKPSVASSYLYDVNIDDNVLKVYSDKLVYNDKDLKYSQENVDKFKNFIKKYFDVKDNKIDVNIDSLDGYQAVVMYIFKNNHSQTEFEVAIEEYKYSVYLSYDEGYYIIYLKDNDKIHVKKVKTSEDKFDILSIEKEYDINFSKDNNEKLVKYIESLFEKDEATQTYMTSVRKDEQNLIDSIKNNDESYLNNKGVKLLYTMKYSGIDCLTPILYLYDDNTFEYYYTFGIAEDPIIPKTGTYDMDIKEILKDATDNLDFTIGLYSIVDKETQKAYYFDVMTDSVGELLKQTNTPLAKCLVQQGEED